MSWKKYCPILTLKRGIRVFQHWETVIESLFCVDLKSHNFSYCLQKTIKASQLYTKASTEQRDMVAPLADKQMIHLHIYSFLASFAFGYASHLSFSFLPNASFMSAKWSICALTESDSIVSSISSFLSFLKAVLPCSRRFFFAEGPILQSRQGTLDLTGCRICILTKCKVCVHLIPWPFSSPWATSEKEWLITGQCS